MVRYALNKDSIFVDAQATLYDKNEIFKCVFCDCPLFYKKPHYRISGPVCGHFFHNVNREEAQEIEIDCISKDFVSSRNESATHKYAKIQAIDILKATTEIYFKQDKFQPVQEHPYSGRRADIAVINKKGAGFLNYEIQTSPTSFDSIKARVEKDRSNYVGQTIYAIGEVNTKGSTNDRNKGVGGLGVSQGVLLTSCLQNYGIAQNIEKVITRREFITILDHRTNHSYTEEKDLEHYIKFNQHKDINGHNEISDVTTDTTAEVIYQAILEHEKLLKNPVIFDMGSTGKSSISNSNDTFEEFSGDDDDTEKYETLLAELDLDLLHNLKLLCKTHQGQIGAAIEFDIHTQKAKTVLVGERVDCSQWINFQDLYISQADFNSTTSSCKTTKEEEENFLYLEIIDRRIESYDRFNPINNFSQDIASRVQRLKIGDKCTWIGAPHWWNPKGEAIKDIKEGKVSLDILHPDKYIPREEVILIESVE